MSAKFPRGGSKPILSHPSIIKGIQNLCKDEIEKSVPRYDCSSSLNKPSDAKRRVLGRIFFYSTLTLMKDSSIKLNWRIEGISMDFYCAPLTIIKLMLLKRVALLKDIYM